MKITPDEVTKAFRGLAIAASRTREMVDAQGKQGLVSGMPRRQADAIRQFVLDAHRDIDRIVAAFESPHK